MVREAFAADLVRAAAFADGVDELDAVGVDHPEPGRSRQEDPRPVLMRLEPRFSRPEITSQLHKYLDEARGI